MAIIHRAQIRPTKLELLGGWLPSQPWFPASAETELVSVGAYRFDDPDGEVGIETLLIRSGQALLQVPLTYRHAPLPEADTWLVGTMEHSVLGNRWVYDALGDPVYTTAVITAIATGGTQAEELVQLDGRQEPRAATVHVRGSGSAGGDVPASGQELTIRRVLNEEPTPTRVRHTLTGEWAGQVTPIVLATLEAR